MLRDSQNRIRSMSMIHQTLYQSHDFAQVDFDQFLSGVVQDISERRQSEKRLKRPNESLESLVLERTNELRESLKELEAFSYSVAHDLRSPMRAIVAFSALLMEATQEVLGPDTLCPLNKISAAGMRMGKLIDALLSLSQLTRSTLQPVHTSMSDMATDILQQLMESEPGRLADVSMGRDDSDPEAPFLVQHKGCGFDMALAGRLFRPFRRLHREDEFTGTGLGLSIVQRIVSRHGGRVWARSSPGEGATFYFTIPPEQAVDQRE